MILESVATVNKPKRKYNKVKNQDNKVGNESKPKRQYKKRKIDSKRLLLHIVFELRFLCLFVLKLSQKNI